MALRHRLVGRAARLYWRLVRPRTLGVRAIVMDEGGRVLLVRHTYLDGWYLPGGGVKKRESVFAALSRELREEASLSLERVERVLGIYHSRREAKDDHVVVAVARPSAAPDPPVIADPREVAEAGWFRPDALPPDVSPATARRIAEFRGERTVSPDW